MLGRAIGVLGLAGMGAFGVATVGEQKQPEDSPLSGPRVRDRAISLTFAGEGMMMSAMRPEEAVAGAMTLAPETKAALERIFNQRGRMLVRFVLENIDLLNRLNVSGSAGDHWATSALVIRGLGRLQTMGFEGDLAGRVRASLPEERRAEFDEGMREHWIARAMAKTSKARSAITKGDVYGAKLEASFATLGQELEAAFQRAERSGEFVVAYLLDGLKLSRGQRETIDGIVFAKMDAMAEEAPEAEKIKTLLSITAYLTEEQRVALMRKINGP